MGKPPAERKISATILEFGEPYLSQLVTEDAQIMVVREAYKLVVLVWNAHVSATPRWGRPQFLAMLEQQKLNPAMPAEARGFLDFLSQRWEEKFSDVPYCVGEWHVKIKHDGTMSFACDARLPPPRRS